MRISIIIPAFNEERLIAETLRHVNAAVPAFSRRGWQTELIVCDNNSTDGTASLARAGGAKVVVEPINQIARARNTGAAAASGDWLLFVDADSQPRLELFEDVAEQVASGRCLAGGCTVHLEAGNYPFGRLMVSFWNGLSRAAHLMAGSFIFCEAAAFRQIGGFDQNLFVAEEIDLSKRLKRVARHASKSIVILHRHPLITSARKMRLYTPWEHLRFLAKTLLARGKTFNSRDECSIWYDGRR